MKFNAVLWIYIQLNNNSERRKYNDNTYVSCKLACDFERSAYNGRFSRGIVCCGTFHTPAFRSYERYLASSWTFIEITHSSIWRMTQKNVYPGSLDTKAYYELDTRTGCFPVLTGSIQFIFVWIRPFFVTANIRPGRICASMIGNFRAVNFFSATLSLKTPSLRVVLFRKEGPHHCVSVFLWCPICQLPATEVPSAGLITAR